MRDIEEEVQWITKEHEDGSVSVVGFLGFKHGVTVPLKHVGDTEMEERAKRQVVAHIFQEIFGDVDMQLRDLEACISRAMPPYYYSDEPIVRCRRIQRYIWNRLSGPHGAELLGLRKSHE